ncbi:MAG: helix-turn-helix transcriptional regulator [Armatimonadetes bacterium]|nr:helix-turn-helix transcriptional regulator [Armatimonadota bacterium]
MTLKKPDTPQWEGQVDVLYFDQDQITAIASAVRSEIFWTFTWDEPMSARDIASAVGKSAQTVRYHINELVRVGLLLPVEHRKRRSRLEEAYVQAGISNLTLPRPVPPEYQEQMNRGFDSMMRAVSKERALAGAVLNDGPELRPFARFIKSVVRLDASNAEKAQAILSEALRQIEGLEQPDGTRTNVWVYMSPSIGECRRVLNKKPLGNGRRPNRDDD